MPYAVGDIKICSACRAELPLSAFDRNRAQKDGLSNQCNPCNRASRNKWKEINPEKHRARQHKNRYGLLMEEYLAMLTATGGKCQVCGDLPKAPFKCLDVDHDHATGRVRGLLCRPCNLSLGGARNDPLILRALAEYLEGQAI